MTTGSLSQYEETSFWAHSYGEYVPNAPLAGDRNVDVAIIGGGFTGLSAALEFKRDNPGATVAVLEAAVVGYGASGRNGGFNMKLFGLEPEVTKLRWGRQRTIDAHRYALRAVAWVKQLIEQNKLNSDYRHTGMLRKEDLPPLQPSLSAAAQAFPIPPSGSLRFEDVERNLYLEALSRTHQNVSAAARVLGLSRGKLRRRMAVLKIEEV